MFIRTTAILSLVAAAVNAGSSSTCRTELGSKSVKVLPTSTETSTSLRPTVTVVTHSTVTKYVGTYTLTSFTTSVSTYTDPTVTDTFSSTTTEYSVETDTVISTVSVTDTQTDTAYSTSTTIVPTTAGFMNIQDTVNMNNLKRRAIGRPDYPYAVAKRATNKAATTASGIAGAIYPTLVDCTTVVPNPTPKTVYKTGKPVTVFPRFAATTTKTITIGSVTTVVPPDVSTTLTSTWTSSVTTYTTELDYQTQWVTTTSTSVLPGPTVYNACNSDNVFGSGFTSGGTAYFVDNVSNNGPGVSSNYKTVADGATSAMDCCYSCYSTGTCETFLFRATSKSCFLLYHKGETCPSQANHPVIMLSEKGSDTGAGYTVGNGNCGYAYSGNSDGSVFAVDQ